MNKVLISTLLAISLLLSACSFSSEPENQDDNQNDPFSQGPSADQGPESMKGPSTAPPTEEERAEVERTHQVIETSYTDSEGEHSIRLVFNIDKDEIRGILLQPNFVGEKREHYHELTKQTVFKKISELDIQPVEAIPEFSKAYVDALNKAIAMYKEKSAL